MVDGASSKISADVAANMTSYRLYYIQFTGPRVEVQEYKLIFPGMICLGDQEQKCVINSSHS